jgi:hypothetical protein
MKGLKHRVSGPRIERFTQIKTGHFGRRVIAQRFNLKPRILRNFILHSDKDLSHRDDQLKRGMASLVETTFKH